MGFGVQGLYEASRSQVSQHAFASQKVWFNFQIPGIIDNYVF